MTTSILSVVLGLGISLGATFVPGQAYANIGGANYDVGSYECINEQLGLTANFTYGDRKTPMKGNIETRKESLTLSCVGPRAADPEHVRLFQRLYLYPTQVCYANYANGETLIAGTLNSMGLVSLNVILLSEVGTMKAKAKLLCQSVEPSEPSNPW